MPAGLRVALVVDDDPAVRALISAALVRSGWSVVEAGDPADAVSASVRLTSRVDLLVTDFEMPGATGVFLADALRHRNAALPVLLVTGADVPGPLPREPFGLVRKPFAIDDLLAHVRSVTTA